MTLQDIRAELAALTSHPLTPTNIEAIRFDGSSIVAEFDNPLTSELEDAKDEAKRADDDAKESERIADDLKTQLEAAEERIDELSEHGTAELLKQYKERAENAEDLARRYREEATQSERALAMLRKRKGLEAGYVACYHEVMAYIHNCQKDPKAAALVAKIHSLK